MVSRRGRSPQRRSRPPRARAAAKVRQLEISSLAAGGDGVGRDEGGRVVFVPRTAPGDVIAAELVHETASYARGELREVRRPSPARRAAGCATFDAGCGGCQWLHVEESAQRAAKQALVTSALRNVPALEVRPLLAPVAPLGWRRRARFHVRGGRLGLFAARSQRLLETTRCPQLHDALEAALAVVAARPPRDGELALAVGVGGRVALAHDAPWPGAGALVGRAGIVGIAAADGRWGEPVLELEPGLWGDAAAFAQASEQGNAAIAREVVAALGAGGGRALLELFAGAGNLTRAIVAAGWRVVATDVVAPAVPPGGREVEWITADAGEALRLVGPRRGELAAAVLDPPRAGARDLLDALAALELERLVYVSCDPATLARDVERLTRAGYHAVFAQAIDTMPQTAHLEIVLSLRRGAAG
ncbi:MAG: TRAM domain-containing protein [Kofleriaceae bacterium]